jgi:hypothetical protein
MTGLPFPRSGVPNPSTWNDGTMERGSQLDGEKLAFLSPSNGAVRRHIKKAEIMNHDNRHRD